MFGWVSGGRNTFWHRKKPSCHSNGKNKNKFLSDVSRHIRVICLFLKNKVGVFFVPTNFPNLRIVDGWGPITTFSRLRISVVAVNCQDVTLSLLPRLSLFCSDLNRNWFSFVHVFSTLFYFIDFTTDVVNTCRQTDTENWRNEMTLNT